MTIPVLPCYLANRPTRTDDHLEVRDKYHGTPRWAVSRADDSMMETAIARAVEAAPAVAAIAPHERQRILRHCLTRLHEEANELAAILVQEGGKPLQRILTAQQQKMVLGLAQTDHRAVQ